MSKIKTVEHDWCEFAQKRSFSEHEADKALGRAQAKRYRRAGATRRGIGNVENRHYYCGACDGYHLTHQSKRQHYSIMDELAKLAVA